MGLKSPSKYIPLARLMQIKQDHYIGAGGQEYASFEVDSLIADKLVREAERWEASRLREYRNQNKPVYSMDKLREYMEKVQNDYFSKRDASGVTPF